MLDYSKYYPALVTVTVDGHAFIYWTQMKLSAFTELNYGRGKYHWFEYLGKQTSEQCKKLYPHTPILDAEDERISKFKRDRIQELLEMVRDV